ncbi:conserved protein of unknown function [Burkholderia multivorans]
MNDAHGDLGGMRGLITTNTRIMGELGARALVLGKFLEAALPCLTAAQRDEVRRSFRQGVEDVMSLMDDVQLPAEYHSTLLAVTNSILAQLGDPGTSRT